MIKLRKGIFPLICLLMPFLQIGCDDGFDPKTGTAEKYVLYALSGSVENTPGGGAGSFFKKIKLSRVYNIDQYDITKYSVEPVVGADVVISCGDSLFRCREEYSRVDNEVLYLPTGAIPNYPNQIMKICATFPNGKSITAQTKMLNMNYFTKDLPYYSGFTSVVNRFIWGNSFNLHWESNRNPNLFFCKLSVTYCEFTDTGTYYYTKLLPYRLVKNDGKLEYVYPSYQFEKSISFNYDAIDSAIAGIGAGKPDKSKIMLYFITMSLLEFNSDLTYYYSSIHGFLDRFSIRLDETTYTNVVGGIGVFGTTTQLNEKMYFHPDYPGIFGYQVFLER